MEKRLLGIEEISQVIGIKSQTIRAELRLVAIGSNGSYLNKWDEATKTILKISPNFCQKPG